MKKLIFYLIFTFLLILPLMTMSQKLGQKCIIKGFNDSTFYPSATYLDYSPKSVFAKIGFYENLDSTKLWVKGNETYRRFFIKSDSTVITDTLFLDSSSYFSSTLVLGEKSKFYEVNFISNSLTSKRISVNNYSHNLSNSNNYSIGLYGCFQPFKVSKNKLPIVIDDKNLVNYYSRLTFQDINLGKSKSYELYKRVDEKPNTFKCIGEKNDLMISKPELILGTGDQVYTDAGYKYKPKFKRWRSIYENHPLSAWGYLCQKPVALLDTVEFRNHINKTYNAFNSFETLDTVFRNLPVISIWDDHEIRDGWGSHGDEYNSKGVLNEEWESYFNDTKTGFYFHQFSQNNGTSFDKQMTFSQEKVFKDFHIYTLDLRSNRRSGDSSFSQVLSLNQKVDFEKWSRNISDNSKVILVSSIPFFYRNNSFSEGVANFGTLFELDDDLQDSWIKNQNDYNFLLRKIIEMRERNISVIIASGDVHAGAITEVWYRGKEDDDSLNKVLCYEIIASGLSHESLGEYQSKFMLKSRNSSLRQRVKNPRFNLELNDSLSYKIYPSTRVHRADLNYGAIEVVDDSISLNLFFVKELKGNVVLEQNIVGTNWYKDFTKHQSLYHQTGMQKYRIRRKAYWTPPTAESKKKLIISKQL